MNKSPGVIQLLPQDVIERIKAGEVVQKPSAAVKELVENALDAGSTEIIVQVSMDCLREISVQDNGCGISDLTLAVQRHTTSKLQKVDDLFALQSFGFRGEALASIVQATGRVHIVSRTIDRPVAFQQSFSPASKQASKATPCARKPGTTVTLHDLFATMKQRQKMTNDYPSIIQLLQSYAVLYAPRGISFVCQKLKKAQPDLNTGSIVKQNQQLSDISTETHGLLSVSQQEVTKKVLAQIHGSQLLESLAYCESKLLGKESHRKSNNNNTTDRLNDVNLSLLSDMAGIPMHVSNVEDVARVVEVDGEIFSCQFWCLFTKPTSKHLQQRTSLNLILFINNRLVECAPLKKRLEELYSNGKHLIFLAIEVPPQQVDVNIHPTKKLVALLFQEEVIDHVSARLSTAMKNLDRGFTSSQVLGTSSPSVSNRKRGPPHDSEGKENPSTCEENEDTNARASNLNPYKKKPLSSKRVRTHYTDPQGAMEPFLFQESPHEANCPLLGSSSEIDLTQPGAFADVAKQCTCRQTIRLPRLSFCRPKRIPPTECTYKSIAQLRQPLFEPHPYTLKLRTGYHIGTVSAYRSLIQCGKELVLMNHYRAAVELFYQIALLRFNGGAAVASMAFSVDIASVVTAALRLETKDSNIIGKEAATCLWEHAEMLQEYFSIILALAPDGTVVLRGLPILLDGWEPMPHGLPLFLLRLATKVNWSEEKPCFDGICRELGWFYAELPLKEDAISSFVRHTLFPALCTLMVVPRSYVDEGGMITLTCLDNLYRVFERC
ncbi:DNA mismatch repair protein MLH1 [Fistulifera solaris]|jgi:DNA mismatch repair protein MutL|uniref:DNA mismatch repair protein MLH1 n=1 Tax=Fistulifera solaris TaxID=1519565 RepID=A0A1Z5JVS2_FISSO|nr:DNA mismatch repair protein MLH1 [Fistulifera solaris]|eukprot:GAX18029.1 DNA mismatch repair protein MLH1 [Fistulifera solaris]